MCAVFWYCQHILLFCFCHMFNVWEIIISHVYLCHLFFYFCKFVAQPNCQQLLASRWYDEFPGWRRRHWAGKFVTCVFIGFLYPLFAICYLIAPKSRYGLFIRKPFIKFICHTASYLTFLFLLLLASQHIVTTEQGRQDRQGPAPTTVEWMILPWVLGELKWWGQQLTTVISGCHHILK